MDHYRYFSASPHPCVAELWEYKGLTAKEISERVTYSAERELGQAVDNIEHTESFSAAGLEIVKVFFQPGTYINTTLTTHMARFF